MTGAFLYCFKRKKITDPISDPLIYVLRFLCECIDCRLYIFCRLLCNAFQYRNDIGGTLVEGTLHLAERIAPTEEVADVVHLICEDQFEHFCTFLITDGLGHNLNVIKDRGYFLHTTCADPHGQYRRQ